MKLEMHINMWQRLTWLLRIFMGVNVKIGSLSLIGRLIATQGEKSLEGCGLIVKARYLWSLREEESEQRRQNEEHMSERVLRQGQRS